MTNATDNEYKFKIASYLDEKSLELARAIKAFGECDKSFLDREVGRFTARLRDLIDLPVGRSEQVRKRDPFRQKRVKAPKSQPKTVRKRPKGGLNPDPKKRFIVDQKAYSRFLNAARAKIARTLGKREFEVALQKEGQQALFMEFIGSHETDPVKYLNSLDVKALSTLFREPKPGRKVHVTASTDSEESGETGTAEAKSEETGGPIESTDTILALLKATRTNGNFVRKDPQVLAAQLARIDVGDINVTNIKALQVRARQQAKRLQTLSMQRERDWSMIMTTNLRLLKSQKRLLSLGMGYVPKNFIQYALIVPSVMDGILEVDLEAKGKPLIVKDQKTLLRLLKQQHGQAPWIERT